MSVYILTVGLEIHAELKTKTKMFCLSPNDPDEKHPNVNVCPICMGHPGTLPIINKKAVESVIRVGLALHGKIPDYARFDRKNYFYPDLPKGYQISQYQHPLVIGGALALPGLDKKINITRVHLEEDTGRLIHEGDTSLVDFNRAGVPLMELVTEPEISNAQEARAFAEELQLLLRYLDVSDTNMEKGEMRVEANISLSRDKEQRGTKVEVKNLNSFRSVERAIEYEYHRQAKILDDQGVIKQETRGWDELKNRTVAQRSKEEAHDYRYFPEPDLPPLNLTKKEDFDLDFMRKSLPELPWQKRERFVKEYGLNGDMLSMVVRDASLARYFEEVMSELLEWTYDTKKEILIQLTTNYLMTDLQALVKEKNGSFADILITPENFSELMKMIIKKEITSRVAKDLLSEMFASAGDPSEIVKEKKIGQIHDETTLEIVIKKIIENNPNPTADYQSGKETALQFLIGEVMKETKGRANPQAVSELLAAQLKKMID